MRCRHASLTLDPTCDPAAVGGAPVHVPSLQIKDMLGGGGGIHHVAARGVQHALGLACMCGRKGGACLCVCDDGGLSREGRKRVEGLPARLLWDRDLPVVSSTSLGCLHDYMDTF